MLTLKVGNTYRSNKNTIVRIVDKNYDNYRLFVGDDGNNYSIGGVSDLIELEECLSEDGIDE